ncbi:MAG TPA: cyclic nucleotide-binding domain-containing protein [Rickettsiales bacterium]|nr:cyclic nucleotide-binding domain-containing protein [Rickettsiales bacterium]
MAEIKINAGEVLFNEGDVADVAYVVTSGSIELAYAQNATQVSLGKVEAGRAFGELAIFDPDALRPYTAVALEDTTLQPVSLEEFQKLFAACPDIIKPLLLLAFEKILPTRTKVQAPVTLVPRGDIATITIAPGTDVLRAQFKPVEIPASALPFRIGGYPEDGERNRKDQLHLAIASHKNPMIVSRQHCEITVDDKDNIVVSDLGSRFCTIVNGLMIGRGRGVYSAPLQKGDNEVYLGSKDTTYKLLITCG